MVSEVPAPPKSSDEGCLFDGPRGTGSVQEVHIAGYDIVNLVKGRVICGYQVEVIWI